MSANSNLGFEREFQHLEIVSVEKSKTAGNLSCNQQKNRYENFLAYDHSRFVLQPLDNETNSCSDYINANFIPVNHSLYSSHNSYNHLATIR